MMHHGHGHGKKAAAAEGETPVKMGHGHGMMGHGHGHGHGHGKGAAAATAGDGGSTRGQSKGYALIAVVYLLGLIMGALDMSIVNPARTVIQNTMSVNDALGVWVITIYTLAYAASIPVMGKLADRSGRKNIYLLCILLFGGGSLLCGLARFTNSFELLLAARVIQAMGGGGIMPVATAEFGTAFPEEKRGMALGMVGMVYGLASILGPSVGSGILELFGQTEWQFIFFVNVPICLFVIVFGLAKLPNSKADEVKPIDGLGIVLLTSMTLSLMYGLKNINFFDLGASITSTDVWPFLLIFIVLLPLFMIRERKAADPIINPKYFTNLNIVITLCCAIASGIIMMGTIFFPQFCENAMMMKSGSGGYFIALLGVGTAFGSMGSGGLIDKFGVKPVLGAGFVGCIVGSLFMAFVACEFPSLLTVCLSMFLSGAGLGFTMGTPLNYMMLNNTDDSESNSALATMSLVRSIGTAVAPAIMVAFIVHASAGMQDSLMNALPKQVSVTPLPHAVELDQKMADLRADENTAEMLEGLDIPELSSYTTVEVNMDNAEGTYDVVVSDEMLEKLQNSDVTTIVEVTKEMTTEMFGQIKPQLVADVTEGVESGIAAMEEKALEMADALVEMDNGLAEMQSGYNELSSGIAKMDGNISNASSKINQFNAQIAQMSSAIAELNSNIAEISSGITAMTAQADQMAATMGEDNPAVVALRDKISEMETGKAEMESAVAEMQAGLAGITAARDGITQGRTGMSQGRAQMADAQSQMMAGRQELADARAELQTAYESLMETIAQLRDVDAAIPALFDEAEANYLKAIDENAEEIQRTYQETLNGGFRGMAIFVAICALIGLLLLIPYRENKRKDGEGAVAVDEAAAEMAEAAVEA